MPDLAAEPPPPVDRGHAISFRQIDGQLDVVIDEGVGVEDRTAVRAELRQDRFEIPRSTERPSFRRLPGPSRNTSGHRVPPSG